jgi:hypothetical protein
MEHALYTTHNEFVGMLMKVPANDLGVAFGMYICTEVLFV